MHQPIAFLQPKILVNGRRITARIPSTRLGRPDFDVELELWGIATEQPNGEYHAYARVVDYEYIVVVALTISFTGDIDAAVAASEKAAAE